MTTKTSLNRLSIPGVDNDLPQVDASDQKTRRSKRKGLTDISNKLIEKIADVTKKVVAGGRKRKFSNGGAENEENNTSQISITTSNNDSLLIIENGSGEKSRPSTSSTKSRFSSARKELRTEEKPQINVKKQRIQRLLPIQIKCSDPKDCLEQIDEMYDIYYDLEVQSTPKPYMSRQSDINYKMRAILVDWLLEVHYKFKLQTATLWLCVNILDRYLEIVDIPRSKLQLIGVSSLFIACKYEESLPPEVRDCVYITDYAYDREEVLKMESSILTALTFNLLVPTGYHFITRLLNRIKASTRTTLLASYYAERNLQEQECFVVLPHVLAAAAVYLALKQQAPRSEKVWNRTLEEESGLTEADLINTAKIMIKHVSEEPVTTSKRHLNAARKKYSSERYQHVASLDLPIIS
eukprot:gene3985-5709_t